MLKENPIEQGQKLAERVLSETSDSTFNVNFDLSTIPAAVERTCKKFADHIANCLTLADLRKSNHEEAGTFPIAVVGHGRAGKDTIAEMLGKLTGLTYGGSMSRTVLPLVADSLGLLPEEAWPTRHEQRRYWYEWCNEFRKDDPALIAKMLLGTADFVVGIRDKVELEACIEQGLFRHFVWVDRPNLPKDPTLTYDLSDLIGLGRKYQAESPDKTLVLSAVNNFKDFEYLNGQAKTVCYAFNLLRV